ncbi:MAG: PBECR2 nuclease fold domain-containing protein [Oscillospiraceae bacterium]|nr:PBECR2 nuclease fold domain-containing protein [Oscillospiraceae bacterium]
MPDNLTVLPGKVGKITETVINTLGLTVTPDTPIYIGESNINHMMKRHPNEYIKYGAYIHDIINAPDYVGIKPNDDSIEYVRNFPVDNDYVKVAVRVSGSGTYFARSIYILNPNKVNNFIETGTLKPLTLGQA